MAHHLLSKRLGDSGLYKTREKRRIRVKKKILVVDDEASILTLLRFKLSKCGFEIETASSGSQFWEKAFAFKPDLIILDIWLNGKLGTEIYHDLLSAGFDAGIPVIFVTALIEEHPQKQSSTGQYILYSKPLNFERLLEGVSRLLGRVKSKQLVDINPHGT